MMCEISPIKLLGVCCARAMRTGGPAHSTRRSCRGMRVGSLVFEIKPCIPKSECRVFVVPSPDSAVLSRFTSL